jgi:hypothetical protein
VLEAAEEPQETYVYRRVIPNHFNSSKNEVSLEAFALGTAIDGLSVYDACKVSPRKALQMVIDDNRHKMELAADEVERAKKQTWLSKNPNVETLVQKGWRIVKIPISEVIVMGFGIEEADAQGHLNILGSRPQFENHVADFTELINVGKATLLTDAQCLSLE